MAMRLQKRRIALRRQRAHLQGMDKPTPRATRRPAPFAKPAHWSNEPAPLPEPAKDESDPAGLSPTRYGDWVRDGIAVDF
jgi:hypothetical protein